MRRVGLRALKWPFEKGDVEAFLLPLHIIEIRLQLACRSTRRRSHLADKRHRSSSFSSRTLFLYVNNGIEKLSLQTAVDVSVARKPHFIMPFPRDPDFIERPALQTWVEQQYAGPASRRALVGLGGFGYGDSALFTVMVDG
ncbi:Fc.00g082340.m01.CDS01 [Cosmosporella sp. VM-42]